ncbi:uncharacterized protein [Clytia hemisphaerica]|uniref:Uncharacterized protein n=1 Tax=Clytia hemisphaerica TaxID=252671 RepID=A0A7M5X9Z5_9CNID
MAVWKNSLKLWTMLVVLFDVLFLTSGLANQDDKDHKISIDAYLQPRHFWPLDYSTWVREIIENKNPTVQGRSTLSVSGNGNGFLEFSPLKSSANLGSFQHACLVDPANCNKGLTVSFWTKLTSIKRSSSKETFRFLGGVTTLVGLQFFYEVDGGTNKIIAKWYSKDIHSSSAVIKPNTWYNVMVTLTQNQMQMYVDGQTKQKEKSVNLNYNPKTVLDLEIGQYPNLVFNRLTAFKDSKVQMDNLVIWDRVLGETERKKIHVVELGQIEANCKNSNDKYLITWKQLKDPYQQLRHFKVTWLTEEGMQSSATFSNTKTLSALIDGFVGNVSYSFKVVAFTTSNMFVEHSVKCPVIQTNNKFRLSSVSPTTATIFWAAPQPQYSYEVRLGEMQLVSSKTTNPFKYEIQNLDPNTSFKVTIVRTKMSSVEGDDSNESGEVVEFIGSFTTKTLASSFKTSVQSGNVKINTWNTSTIHMVLHPELKGKPMTYILLQKELYNPRARPERRIPWTNVKNSWLDFTLTKLNPNTWYSFDIELRDRDSKEPGPRMAKPIIWQTKARFPSEDLTIELNSIASNSLSISIRLPYEFSAASHIKLTANHVPSKKIGAKGWKIPSKTQIFSLSAKNNYTLVRLVHHQKYQIFAQLGNGVEFGNSSNIITAKTDDINECEMNSAICGEHSKCTNIEGSYNCSCIHKGFVEKTVGKGCRDIDECSDREKTACQVDEQCVNTIGSYNCICQQNYTRVNGVCVSKEVKITSCKYETYRNMTWFTAKAGQRNKQNCPDGYEGFVYRECTMEGSKATWKKPDSTNCVNKALAVLLNSQKMESPTVVASSLNNFVQEQTNDMTTGDVSTIVDMMGSLATSSKQGVDGQATEKFTENMINVASTLLEDKTQSTWNEFSEEKRSEKAANLLTAADHIVEASANALNENKTIENIETENIVMKLKRVEKKSTVDSVTVSDNIELPGDALGNEQSTIAIVEYKGMAKILGVPKNTTLQKQSNISKAYLNSQILSISIFPSTKKTFDKPVVFTQQHRGITNNSVPNCVYWHESTFGSHWSDEGCMVNTWNASHVTCHCYHLTNFAILMSVTDAPKQLSEENVLALSLITVIGITISLGALVISFLSFVFIKAIRSLRNTVHKHLCVALFIAEGIFLFGIDKTGHKIGCQVIAASLHYFFLVAFFIMGLEGIVLYMMLVRVYRSMGTSGYGSPKFIALCWVLPLVVITVNVFIDQNAYGDINGACWLSIENGFIWSFVGPVLLIVGMNFVFLGLTIKVMTEKAKRRNTAVEEIWFWTKGVCLLLSILGVTWVFGVLYINQDTLFFAYIFAIVNSLQGLSIFVFHCACDPRVRKAYRDFFLCVSVRQKHELMRSMSRTRSTSGSKASMRKSLHSTRGNQLIIGRSKESMPLYSNGLSSTPENSVGLLVGTNKF